MNVGSNQRSIKPSSRKPVIIGVLVSLLREVRLAVPLRSEKLGAHKQYAFRYKGIREMSDEKK